MCGCNTDGIRLIKTIYEFAKAIQNILILGAGGVVQTVPRLFVNKIFRNIWIYNIDFFCMHNLVKKAFNFKFTQKQAEYTKKMVLNYLKKGFDYEYFEKDSFNTKCGLFKL